MIEFQIFFIYVNFSDGTAMRLWNTDVLNINWKERISSGTSKRKEDFAGRLW